MELFDWLEKDPEIIEIDTVDSPSDYQFVSLDTTPQFDIELSALLQFITVPAALNQREMITTIPITNEIVYQLALDNIAPCFDSVKGIFLAESSIPFEIQYSRILSEVKNTVYKMVENNTLNPIVSDLYGSHTQRPRGLINKTVPLKILTNKIEPINNAEFYEAWQFLEQTYMNAYKCLSLIPTNWYYSSDLRNSMAIRFFSTVSDQIYIYVDDPTNRVIGLEIY